MFDRLNRSIELTKASWRVLMQDKELMILPVLSGLCCLVVVASFVLPFVSIGPAGSGGGGGLETTPDGEVQLTGVQGGLVLLLYMALYSVTIFFQSAVVAGAMERMNGGDPTVGSSLAAAWRRIGTIVLWGMIAGTVGLVLRSIQERSELVGRIVVGLVGAAWSLATFFVVPVIVMEDRSVGDSVRASLALFKERWGEAALGSGGLGLLSVLLMLPVIALGAFLINIGQPLVALALGVPALLLISVLMATLQGIYVAALYRFARDDQVPDGLDRQLLEGAFRSR